MFYFLALAQFPPLCISLFVSEGRAHVTSDGVAGLPGSCVREVFTSWEMSDASVSVMSRAKKSHKMWIIC